MQEQQYVIHNTIEMTEEQVRWWQLLTDGNEIREMEMLFLFDECDGIVGKTIVKYRAKRFAEEDDSLDLNTIWFCKDNPEMMRKVLEDLFLEPVDNTYYEAIIDVMNENGWDFRSLMEEHMKDKNMRIWRIISCKKKECFAEHSRENLKNKLLLGLA